MEKTDDIVLGVRHAWGEDVPFRLSQRDRRQHLLAVGKSGVGKSTLLFNLVMQDIVAGRGVAVIDPHGDLCAEILAHIPSWRAEDVTYFAPSDTEYPIAFNLLAGIAPERRHLVVDGIVSVFKTLWPEFFGPRMENILRHALATLAECQNVSLLSLQRMLSDDEYRRWAIKQVKDPLVRAFWALKFDVHDEKTRAEYVAPILNKVDAFLLSPAMRNILGQVRRRLDARLMMDRSRILLVNLSKGKIGDENANLLGSLWVTQFRLAAMSRADVPEKDRRDFALYVDEWQSFVSESFVSALSECRKYRLSLVLANQYFGQLGESIRAAVFGNVGSIVAFRVGAEDAKILAETFGDSFTAAQFTSLSNGETYAKLLSNGQDVQPFLGRTPLPQWKRHGRAEEIVRRSREKYASQRVIVERKINIWSQ